MSSHKFILTKNIIDDKNIIVNYKNIFYSYKSAQNPARPET